MDQAVRFLVAILLLSSTALAEKITIRLPPQGTGCAHVSAEDSKGNIVGTFTVDELLSKETDEECSVKCQVRSFLLNSPATTVDEIKQVVDQKEVSGGIKEGEKELSVK